MNTMPPARIEGRSALVAYATETGNAYDFAEELGRLLKRIHFWTRVSELDALDAASRFQKSLTAYSVVLIVVSTTGQGELPANGRLFWKSLLRKKLPPTFLKDVRLTTFGLGDSSYPKFNWAARKLHKRLLQLGAWELYPRGEADEQNNEGLDASFVPWSTDLRNCLLINYPLPEYINPIPESELLEPGWRLALHTEGRNGFHKSTINGDSELALSECTPITQHASRFVGPTKCSVTPQSLAATLEVNCRMTPQDHWQDVRHLVFTSESKVDYGPGDVLTIFPKNMQDDVDQLLTRMSWTDVADKPIYFAQTTDKHEDNHHLSSPYPRLSSHTTLRALLTEHLDITAIPRRSFFSVISHFTDNQFHKERLLEFTKPEYIDELYDYTTRPRRSILEVLQEFESVRVPWQWAAYVFPELRGRQFSIASGGILKKSSTGAGRFELLVAIVKYKTVIKKVREGVCTRYLAGLPIGTELNVTLQKGALAIDKQEAWRPVIMVGPGTGVAPMRSLIWERRLWDHDMRTKTSAHFPRQGVLGDNVLFFGCRSEGKDYFYREEWDKLRNETSLEVYPAFSRDQTSKIYVQDQIRKQSKQVYSLLHEAGGLVYVCGSSGKMPQAVRAALVDVFLEHGPMDQADAIKYVEDMEKEGRYKQETW